MPKILRAKDQTNEVLTSNLSSIEKSEFITLLGKITDSLKASVK
ncbi:MAG: hypothetical protein ACJ0IB_07145 [Verrucomicrobiales bacterium]